MLLEWKLKKIRLKEQKKLNDNNFALYKNMVDYIKVSDLTELQKEESFQDIIDIMLQAQMENKNIDLFIGNDYEVFCNNIIKEYTSGISITYKITNYIQKYIVTFITLCLIMGFSNKANGDSINVGITVKELILINVIALFLMPILKMRKQGSVDVYPIYLPFQNEKSIRVKKIRNNKSITTPYLVVVAISILLNYVINTIANIDTEKFIIKINPLYIIVVIFVIALIQVYKIMYNKV